MIVIAIIAIFWNICGGKFILKESLLEKRRRDRIEQDEKMEREELLRENHISESNSSASSVSTSSISASSVSASSVSASSLYASSNTDEIMGISSEGQPLVPGQTNSTKLITNLSYQNYFDAPL